MGHHKDNTHSDIKTVAKNTTQKVIDYVFGSSIHSQNLAAVHKSPIKNISHLMKNTTKKEVHHSPIINLGSINNHLHNDIQKHNKTESKPIKNIKNLFAVSNPLGNHL